MPNIGLGLLGGGCAACYQVGVKALWRRGHIPTLIQGVSAGAFNAAMLAGEGPERAHEAWLKRQREGPEAIFPSIGLYGLARNAIAGRRYFHTGESLDRILREDMNMEKVLASPITLEIVVHNRTLRRTEIFANRGEDIPADPKNPRQLVRTVVKSPEMMHAVIKASASLSPFFPPPMINGCKYSDGYWMQLETMAKACDIIFLLDNDQVALSKNEDPGKNENPDDSVMRATILQMFEGFRDALDEAIDTKIELFQERFPEFGTDIDSPRDIMKKLWRELTGTAKKLVVLSPFYQIPTLQLDKFRMPDPKTKYPGDIVTAINESIKQFEKVLDQMKL